MAEASAAGPSAPHSLKGPVPGLIDPTQPSRILRNLGNSLLFASFDPCTASSRASAKTKNTDTRPKRVVVETNQSGERTWRFVPKARLEDGVQDEGAWPRVVLLGGQLVECSEDQWDIYKLDPAYNCLVRPAPLPSIITPTPGMSTPDKIPHDRPAPQTTPTKKRRMATPSPERDPESVPPPSTKRKTAQYRGKSHSIFSSSEEEEEEDEVEEMIIDENSPKGKGRRFVSLGAKERQKKKERERQDRRAKLARKLGRILEETPGFAGPSSSPPTVADPVAEQKGAEMPQWGANPHSYPEWGLPIPQWGFQVPFPPPPPPHGWGHWGSTGAQWDHRTANTRRYPGDEDERRTWGEPDKPFKRPRTTIPTAPTPPPMNKRTLEEHRLAAEREKEKRRRQHREKVSEQQSSRPPGPVSQESTQATAGTPPREPEPELKTDPRSEPPPTADQTPDEAARLAAILESRRKLAALEADRPLWEAEAKKREARERAEEEAGRRKKLEQEVAEKARKQMEDAKRRQEEAKRKAKEKEEAARDEAVRRDRERRRRQNRYASGSWTVQRALERYKTLCESFDNAKFGPNDPPLSFELVPWPVLHSPVSFTVEDIDWAAVEAFFKSVKPFMRGQDYKTFVEKSHRRFHPDRWRSRGLLKSVVDEVERGCLEVAANTVAQALTPLWRDVKG